MGRGQDRRGRWDEGIEVEGGRTIGGRSHPEMERRQEDTSPIGYPLVLFSSLLNPLNPQCPCVVSLGPVLDVLLGKGLVV